MSVAKGLNIYQRLSAIMGEVGVIEKEFKKEIKMATISHDQVTIRLNPLFVKHRVYLAQSTISCETTPHERETFKGIKKEYCTHTAVSLKFVNIDDPSDFVESVIHGEGIGADGKQVGASYSFAIKTALLKGLCIPSGEDEEKYNSAPEPTPFEKAEEEQAKKEAQEFKKNRHEVNKVRGELRELCIENAWDKQQVSEWVYSKAKVAINSMDQRQLVKAIALIKEQFKGTVVNGPDPTNTEPVREEQGVVEGREGYVP